MASTPSRSLSASAAPFDWLAVSASGPVELKNSVMPRVLPVAHTQTAPLGVEAVAGVLAQPKVPPFGPVG